MNNSDSKITSYPVWIRWIPLGPMVILLFVSAVLFYPGADLPFPDYQRYALNTVLSALIGLLSGFALKLHFIQEFHTNCFQEVLRELDDKCHLSSLIQYLQQVDDIQPYNQILEKHVALKNLMSIFTKSLLSILLLFLLFHLKH